MTRDAIRLPEAQTFTAAPLSHCTFVQVDLFYGRTVDFNPWPNQPETRNIRIGQTCPNL